MFRFFLFLMLGYVIWRVIRIVGRTMSNSRRKEGDVFANQPPQKPPQTFKDVKDADFEELPSDDKN